MMRHEQLSNRELINEIRNKSITLAGNSKLKIYGMLRCASGKRMLKKNRVFFKNKSEAVQLGYRPCGHCMKKTYARWMEALE